jgi:hypothetical protein
VKRPPGSKVGSPETVTQRSSPDQVLGSLAEAGQSLRHAREAELVVLLPVPVGGHLEQALEARLARLALLLGLLARGDVDAEADHAAVARLAVGDQQPVLVAVQELVVALVGVQVVVDARAHVLLLGEPGARLEAAAEVRPRDVGIAGAGDEEVRDLGVDLAEAAVAEDEAVIGPVEDDARLEVVGGSDHLVEASLGLLEQGLDLDDAGLEVVHVRRAE